MYLEQIRKSEMAYYHVSPPSSRELILICLKSVPRNNDFDFLYMLTCKMLHIDTSYIHITNQVISERDVAYLYHIINGTNAYP